MKTRSDSGPYKTDRYFSEPISMKQEDLDRIQNIAFLRPDLAEFNNRGKLNNSKVVRDVLKEFEDRLKSRETAQSDLSPGDILQHLFRFTMENEAFKADLTKAAGVSPHHWMGSVEARLSESDMFIERIAAKKNDRIIGRVIDEFLDNVEFLLWTHVHSHTEDFVAHLSKVSPPAREALKSQIHYGLMLAKAAPERPYSQRFVQSFNELLQAEELENLRSDQQAQLR
jgi:hypothetical protein